MIPETNDNSLLDRVTIERMSPDDLDQILEIERRSFLHPWTRDQFQSELDRRPSVCLSLKTGPLVIGHLIFWAIPPEIQILNIAVAPDHRNQGLGRFLLEYLFAYAGEIKVKEVYLEVRPSNGSARSLYRRMGFVQTGVRKNYYEQEREDALVMARIL